MFKRFLKFLRGEEEEGTSTSLPHDGSYLDHLLGQIQPEVVTSLERCPENDPVLLVVAGVLRHTMLSVFHPVITEPLVDHRSPGMVPPPAPTFDTTKTTDEFGRSEDEESEAEESEVEIVEAEDIDSESSDSEPELDGFGEDTGRIDTAELEAVRVEDVPPPTPKEKTDESEDDEEPNEEVPSEIKEDKKRITEKFDVDEIKKATEDEESTGEIEIRIGLDSSDVTAEIDRNELDDRPRIDAPETLRAGRKFFGILTANDALPPEAQLSIAELMVIRDHLMMRDDSQGKKLLSLVERKFNDAFFGQARLLLTLFPTDDVTALNNDRNIFYEEMILKLGIKRRHRMADDELAVFENLVEHLEENGIQPLLNWFKTESGVNLHIKRKDPTQTEVWEEISKLCARPDVEEYISEFLPTLRWRELNDEEDPYEAIHSTITPELVKEYVVSMIGTCYFVLRAVGDTGLEPYLDTFFDWTKREFDVNGTSMMPILHRRAMTEISPMRKIVEDLYNEYFDDKVESRIESWKSADIEKSLKKTLKSVTGPELGEIAPGDYNLSAFVLDHLLDVRYTESDFPFKVHRLT